MIMKMIQWIETDHIVEKTEIREDKKTFRNISYEMFNS